MTRYLILPGVLLLSSCIFGPEPGKPNLATPGSFRGAGSGGPSLGDQSWHRVFADATLRELISRALRNNPDLAAATYRIEEAQALAGAAQSAWYPSLSGSTSGSGNYGSINAGQVPKSGGRHSESYDISAKLSWEIDLWGRIRRSNQAARARLLASEADRAAVQTSLISSVATAYIDLENLDERLAIANRTSASRVKSYDLVKTRKEGGVGSDLELSQAEALLRQAQIAIPRTEQAIAAKENELRILLGEYPGAVARGGKFGALDSSVHVSAGLTSALLERRADLQSSSQAYQAASADIGVAMALRLPTLTLTGDGGMASGDLGKLLHGHSAFYSIGPQLAGPIFDAGRTFFGVKAAEARQKQALAAYDKAAKQAFREVADALNAYRKSGEIVTRQDELLKSLQNVASIAHLRFEGGTSSYLEVLDAERSLFSAELDLADARRDRLQAVVQTYRALGGGWR